MKVGHGGTLDPLASGVLVLGIGKGTSMLQSYLEGDKQYTAACELGYETDTLDAEGKLVKTAPWCDHVKSIQDVEAIIPKFTGKIQQVPPLYSAIRVDGKRLYEIARGDDSENAENVEIPKRDVEIYGLQVGSTLEDDVIRSGVVDGPNYREKAQSLEEAAAAEAAAAEAAAAANKNDETKDNNNVNEEEEGGQSKKRKRRGKNKKQNKNANKKSLFDELTVPSIQPTSDSSNNSTALNLPQFTLSVQCGGGTYIRSLVRDIGYELNTVATMTGLVRTKQGPFVLGDALVKEDWTAEKIYEAIQSSQERLKY